MVARARYQRKSFAIRVDAKSTQQYRVTVKSILRSFNVANNRPLIEPDLPCLTLGIYDCPDDSWSQRNEIVGRNLSHRTGMACGLTYYGSAVTYFAGKLVIPRDAPSSILHAERGRVREPVGQGQALCLRHAAAFGRIGLHPRHAILHRCKRGRAWT